MDHWFDGRVSQDVLKLLTVEVWQADGASQSQLDTFFHDAPGVRLVDRRVHPLAFVIFGDELTFFVLQYNTTYTNWLLSG